MSAHNKEEYEYLKRLGVCTRCARRDAEPGRTMCFECAEKNRRKAARYYSDREYRERESEKQRARRARRHAEGTCLDCGRTRWNGSNYCRRHYLERRNYAESRPRKAWKESGLCIRCGAERKEGYQYCESCYAEVCRAGLMGVAASKKKPN